MPESTTPRWGVVVVNTGTPDSPAPEDVKAYLAEFLSDKRIVDYPGWFWKPILHGMILRRRPEESGKKYARIWDENGGPLRYGTNRVAQALHEHLTALGHNVEVVPGMRYGNPSQIMQMRDLSKRCDRILVLPLFPQESLTTVGSIRDASKLSGVPYLNVDNYYRTEGYIEALARSVREYWDEHGRGEHLVISFHGIPLRFSKTDPYKGHCQHTSERLAEELGLAEDEWTMTFQSKFGPEKWLTPATIEFVEEKALEGVKRIDVVAPSFAVDCLETVDELGNEVRWEFEKAGGKEFHYIPALNDAPDHIEVLGRVCTEVFAQN